MTLDEYEESLRRGEIAANDATTEDGGESGSDMFARLFGGGGDNGDGSPKPGEYGQIRTAPPMQAADFADAGERGGVESALLNIQRDTGIESDYDGTWAGGLKNAAYATAHAAAGKAVTGAMNKNLQLLAKGVDADGTPLEQLPDREVDYLLDSAGANGAAGWFRRFLGARVSGAWRGEDNLMRQWDATQGAKIADPDERHRARVEYARELARGMIGQREESRQRAGAELEGREETTGGSLLRGLIEQGGYTLPFILGGGVGGTLGSFALAGGSEGLARFNEMRADSLQTDENGNVTVAAGGDDFSTAATKGLARGVMAPAIEMVGGKAATALGGKLLGATIGRIPLFKAMGNRIAATSAGRAVDAFAKRLNFLGRYTGMQGMPEEMAEELEDQVLDAAFGIDRRESEKVDSAALERAAGSFGDFFKGENLKELATSMLLMQVMGGAAGVAVDRSRSRHVDGVLREVVGVAPSELKYYTADEKMAAFKAWADGLTEDEIADTFKKGAEQVNRLVADIRANVGENDLSRDEADAPKFNGGGEFAQTTDDAGRTVWRQTDAESGVTIDAIDLGDGDTSFRITDAMGRTRGAETYEQAVMRANQMLSADYLSGAKRQYLESLTKEGRILSGIDVIAGDSLRDVLDEIEASYGAAAAASLRRRIGVTNGEESGQSFRYVLPDGRSGVAFVLDKIGSVQDMATAAMHEAGRHAGLDMLFDTPEKKMAFLKRIDGKGIDAGTAANGRQAMTPDQRRSFEAEIADIQRQYGLASREDVFKTPEAAEELFAYFTENEFSSPSLKSRFVAGLRKLYRDMFDADLSYNDSDLLAMAGEMNRRMRENTEAGRMRYRSAQERLGREDERVLDENREDAERRRQMRGARRQPNFRHPSAAVQERYEADRAAQGHDVDPETGGDGQLEDTEMPSGRPYLPNPPSRIRREVERQRRYAQRQLERFVDNRPALNAPVERTDEERRLLQDARERRIMDKYPHLWMEMRELMPDAEDEDVLIAVTRALRADAENGTPGQAESDALVSYALKRMENGEELTDAEVRGISARGFTEQMLYNDFGYRRQGDVWVYAGVYFEDRNRPQPRPADGASILSQMRGGQRERNVGAPAESAEASRERVFAPEGARDRNLRRTTRQNAQAVEDATRASREQQERIDAQAHARELRRGVMTDDQRLRLEESYTQNRENADETGNVRDEAPAQQTVEGAGRGERGAAPQAGERPLSQDGAPAQAAGVVKTARGSNFKGLSYEDYGAPPNLDPETADENPGGTGDATGAALLDYARRHDGVLYVPRGWNAYRTALGQWRSKRARGIVDGRPRPKMKDFGVTDTLADWLDGMFDGTSKENNALHKTLFGFFPREGGNDEALDDAPPEVQAIYSRAEEDGVPGAGRIAVAEALLKAHEAYSDWRRKEKERRRTAPERAALRERQRADEQNAYDFDELFAARDAMDEEFANALGVVEGADETDYAILSPSSLQKAAEGDRIRFDHDAEAFAFESFDPEGGVLTVVDYDVDADTETRRRYRITENSIEEITDDGREEEGGVDEDSAGDEEGPADGGGESQGGENRSGGETFTLESATAEQLKAEQERQRQRDEVRRRQNTPLETGTGEIGQTLLDLDGAEGGDLFNQTQSAREGGSTTAASSAENVASQATSKNDTDASNPDIAALTAKAEALAKEYAALPDKEKVSAKGRDLERRIEEAWNAVTAAEQAAGIQTEADEDTAETPVEAPASAPRAEGATASSEATERTEGTETADSAASKSSAPTPAFKRGDTVMLRNAEGGYGAVTFVKDNGDGTATVQRREHNRVPYLPDKVESLTVQVDRLAASGFNRRGLTAEERKAERRGEAIDKANGGGVDEDGNPIIRWRRGDSNLDNLRRLMSGKGSAEVRWRRAKRELQRVGMYGGSMSEHMARLREDTFADGEKEKEGAESIVRRVGDRVVKYRDARNWTQRDFDKIQWHNELFGDRTPYEVRDVVDDDSWSGNYRPPRIVLEQPYVEIREGGGAEARRRLVEDLRRRFGTENVTVKGDPASERMEIDAGPYHISDLKDLNVGIDERTGDYAVWDANIEKRKGADAGGEADVRWRRVTPAEDAAYMDAVERGDTETAERMVREAAARAMPNLEKDKRDGLPKLIPVSSFIGNTEPRLSAYMVPTMPKELMHEIAGWDVVSKSPYSNSFYNANGISWSYKPDRSIRVSNHWNFYSRGETHCRTDKPVVNGKKWVMAEYHADDGRYHVIKEWNVVNDGNETPTESQYQQALDMEAKNEEAIRRWRIKNLDSDSLKALKGLVGKKVHGESFKNGILRSARQDELGRIVADVELSPSHRVVTFNGRDILERMERGGLQWDEHKEEWHRKTAEARGVFLDTETGQLKSANPVTRDDAGNVIPLSQRFNAENVDIRWRRTYTPNPAARTAADNGPLTQREVDEINSVMPPGGRRSTSRDRQERAAREQASRDAFARAFHDAGTWQRVGMLLDKNTRRDAWRAVKESAIRKMQDAGLDLRKYEVRRFERQFGKPMSRWTNAEKEQFVSQSTYYTMDRAYGRKENLSLKLNQDYVKPLEKQIADNGLDEAWTDERGEQNIGADGKPLSKLDVYLMALHGGEYNRMIAERTARAEGGPVLDGSGRSTEYWERQLARFRNEGFDRRAAEAVRLVHEMNKAALQQMVDSGRISQKQVDKWNELSPNYVPLRNSDAAHDLFEQLLFGGDIDEQTYRKAFSGTEYNHAAGRRSLADSPVINSIQQAEWAIARSMDNESRRSLAAQVRADPRMGTVVMQMSKTDFQEAQRQIAVFTQMEADGTITDAQRNRLARLRQNVADTIAGNRLLPRRRMLNQNSEVQSVIDTQGLETDPNGGWVAFKENGDTKYIKLGHHELVDADGNATGNMDELTGNRIAQFVKGQSFVKLGGVMRFVRNLSRGFGMLRTSLSPTFLFSNFLADNGQALRNVFHTLGSGAMRTFEGHAADMGRNGARASALRYLRGQLDPNRYAIDRFTKEWAEAGGQIGGFATESFGDIDERMAASLRRMQRRLSRGRGGWPDALKDGARAIGERFQEWNSAIEMATRISAYATMRENGMGVNDAVSYARDVTVNFNRKGEWTPIFNALYVFSNANIQDMQRTGMTFTGSRAVQLNGTLFVLGLLSAALGFGQDDPDDEAEGGDTWENVGEHRKQNGISFRVGGKVISLPLRGLARMPYYAGHKAFEALTGRRDASEIAGDIGSFMFSSALEPLSTTSSVAQSVAPSILRPAVELMENKSFTGAPIHRTKMSETQVASEMGRQSTSGAAVWLARTLNSLTGGNRNRSGAVDVFPETLEQIGRGLAGTLGTDIGKAVEMVKDVVTFQMPETRDVPFVSRVASDMEKNSRRYHEAVTDFERDQKEYKDLAQEDPSVMAALRRKSPWFKEGNEAWLDELDSLRKLNKKLMVEETRTDGEERKTLNELRMKTQGLFLHRLKNPPTADASAKRAEYGQRNRLIDHMLRGNAAKRKREEREAGRSRP